jgi:hypothetical protein
MDDFSSPSERTPAQEPFFDVDTIGNTYYGFGPNGLEVFDSTGALFSHYFCSRVTGYGTR